MCRLSIISKGMHNGFRTIQSATLHFCLLSILPMTIDLSVSLQQNFGFSEFRPGQRQALEALLRGEHVLVVMPTGAGKSLIYQLAALHLPGLTLVISPLIALMKDQVDSLRRHKIHATFINSTLPASEQNARLRGMVEGQFRLVYVAPERLRSVAFLRALRNQKVSLLAVDEAHCISEWGHDFRPDYLRIAEARKFLNNPLTIALTATATPQVQDDIIWLLGLPTQKASGGTARIVTGFNRPNLKLEVGYASRPETKLRVLRKLLIETKKGAVIIYTGTRREAEEMAEFARVVARVPAEYYHAGLEANERERIQNDFMQCKLSVVASTNAFGMGIDRPDVRLVVHFNLPGSLEAYYQEAGRAGRDNQPARAVLLYAPDDRALQEWFIETSKTAPDVLRRLYDAINLPEGMEAWLTHGELSRRTGMPEVKLNVALAELERAAAVEHLGDEGMQMLLRGGTWNLQAITAAIESGRQHIAHRKKQLDKMVAYAESNDCRRRILLSHFGDSSQVEVPGCCDNCEMQNISKMGTKVEVQARHVTPTPIGTKTPSPASGHQAGLSKLAGLILLDSVRRLPNPVGRQKLAQILKGSQARAVRQFGYDQSTYYGRFDIFSQDGIEGMIDQLIELGDLKVVGGEYPVLRLTPQGIAMLQEKVDIPLKLPKQLSPKFTNKKAIQAAGGTVAYTRQLFNEGIPPAEIARRRDVTLETIYNHLSQAIAAGEVELDSVVPGEVRAQVEAAICQVGSVANLTPLKEALPDEIGFGVIRCVVEAWKRGHEPIPQINEEIAKRDDFINKQTNRFDNRKAIITTESLDRVVELGESINSSAIPELVSALTHSNGNVRRLAASALGKIKNTQAVEPLITLLSHEDKPQIRQYAVKALGLIGDPRALDLLEAIADDENEKNYTRNSAKVAIKEIKTAEKRVSVTQAHSQQPHIESFPSVDEDVIANFLSQLHPRQLPGPWKEGWALGFHSSFSGSDWNRSPVGELAYRLKYQGDLTTLPALLDQVVALLETHPNLIHVDAIVPVPPSTARASDPVRGFAETLAGHFDLKVLPVVVKTRQTEPQKAFHTRAQKRSNVTGAFAVQGPIHNLHLLVVDDLFDSGMTLEEITRVLQSAGAASVCVLTLTRTIHSDA
jgi:ATP-dependent DNA helicase RecQ